MAGAAYLPRIDIRHAAAAYLVPAPLVGVIVGYERHTGTLHVGQSLQQRLRTTVDSLGVIQVMLRHHRQHLCRSLHLGGGYVDLKLGGTQLCLGSVHSLIADDRTTVEVLNTSYRLERYCGYYQQP